MKCLLMIPAFLMMSCSLHAESITRGPLLSTEWGQRGEYAIYATDQERMGCWSTAFAQILYYHRLTPSGSVNYTQDDGSIIDEDLSSYTVDFSLFADSLDEDTPADTIDAVARYVYFVAIVQQKDFYSEVYHLNSSERSEAIAEVFGCDWDYYRSNEYSRSEIFDVIRSEIDANRPCLIYLEAEDGSTAHAMVIDGYRKSRFQSEVHINMGWEGSDNGWYNLESPVLDFDDMDFFRLVTIIP